MRSDTRRGTMIVMRAESMKDLLRKGACENASESIQKASRSLRTPPRGLRERPRAPKRPPRASKTPPRASTRHPRASKNLQEASKTFRNASKSAPGTLQNASRERLRKDTPSGSPYFQEFMLSLDSQPCFSNLS